MCHGETQWIDTSPVLLGLRTCFKENLGTSVTKLMYNTIFKVPREFFSSEKMPNDPQIFIEDFRIIMQKLQGQFLITLKVNIV